ncbi:MAG TPA: hypothetical protein VMS21_04955, partial [Methylomirabilota bacterium]|nr:hypothetical protein [Methylomirabilota bacterium]
IALKPGNAVVWRHPAVPEPITFNSNLTARLQLLPRPAPPDAPPTDAIVHLTNQDVLRGVLHSLDEEHLTLETWYAGRLLIPRGHVTTITPRKTSLDVVYRGPEGLDGWTQGQATVPTLTQGGWSFDEGAFIATQAASIARDVQLPDRMHMEFDLAWNGMLNLAIALYTDFLQPINLGTKDVGPDFGGFYSLQLNNFNVNLMPVKKNHPLVALGSVPLTTLRNKNSARFSVLVDKHRSYVACFLDGQMIKEWNDRNEFIGEGTGIRLVHQQQGGTVRFSNLVITEWDGYTPDAPVTALASDEDWLDFVNGDQITGQLKGIHDGTARLFTGKTDLDIPSERIGSIRLASEPVADSPLQPGHLRAALAGGGQITFQIEDATDDGRVIVSSPNFGRTTLDPSAFVNIDFLP